MEENYTNSFTFDSSSNLQSLALRTFVSILFISVLFIACKNQSPEANLSMADLESGQRLFGMHCAGCHNFKEKAMGPALGGLAGQVSEAWLLSFISDPKALIDKGDERAIGLFNIFHTYMPSYAHLSADSLKAIVAFILSKPAPEKVNLPQGALEDPIVETIAMSDIVLNLNPLAKFPVTNESSPWTRIVKMDHIPSTNQEFVGDLQGQLYRLTDQGPSLFLNMADHFPNFINEPGLATGFGSFAFHPEFLSNGLLYTTHTESANSAKADFSYHDTIPVKLQWVITEWKLKDPKDTTFNATKREILRINFVSQIHGMQDISFNPLAQKGDPDYGLLYIGIGDGGAVENGYVFIATDQDKIWGSVLRIDPLGKNSKNGKYGIPKNNPFLKPGQAPEVYARGFRNPHRLHWLQDGRLLVSNIGHFNIESLYVVDAGDHCGWPFREGKFKVDPYIDLSFVYPVVEEEDEVKYNYPVIQFDHDEGNAISGGYEYLGDKIPAFKGKYVFGTIVRGRLFFVNINDLIKGKQAAFQEWQVKLDGNIKTLFETTKATRVDLRLARDHSGEIYIMTKPDGMLYRLTQ